MRLIILGVITVVIALVLMAFRFVAFESEGMQSLITFGNYAVVLLALYVAYSYIKQRLVQRAQRDLNNEEWDGIGRHVSRIPFPMELAFITGILAMFWYGTVGFHTQVFSHISQWNEEIVEHREIDSKILTVSKDELTNMGKKIYMVQCASCHGSNGEGMDGKAQNHTKRISKESALDAIVSGTHNFNNIYPAGMPGGLLSEESAKEVADFIAKGLTAEKPKGWVACASCHDKSGEGIPFVAPNLKTYSNELVATVLTNGKKGVIGTMPNFSGRLSKNQMIALATYIRSIGK